jgi:hypothetical protein
MANYVTQFGFDINNPIGTLTPTDYSNAGNMDLGSYKYVISFVSNFGETLAGPASATGITTSGSMLLSNIPIGGENVINRKIYRTNEGVFLTYYLLTTINNIITEFVDTINDSDLGSVLPYTNTAGSLTAIYGNATFSEPPAELFNTIVASGVNETDATPMPSVQTTFVQNASGLNGVMLPKVDIVGKRLVVTNTSLVNILNIYPNYSLGDVIVPISFPGAYQLAVNSTATFIAVDVDYYYVV